MSYRRVPDADFEAVKRGYVAAFQARDALAASLLARTIRRTLLPGTGEGPEGCPIAAGEERRIGTGLERALGQGWNSVEDWGCWTSERHSSLVFLISAGTPLPLRLDLNLDAYLPLGGRRRLRICPPSGIETLVIFAVGSTAQRASLMIRPDDVDSSGRVELVMEGSGLCSPFEVGAEDGRSLGIALHSVAASIDVSDASTIGRFDLTLDRGSVTAGGHDMSHLLGVGWSHLEEWGVWGVSKQMEIGFRLPSHVVDDVCLSIRLRAYIPNAETTVYMTASLNRSIVSVNRFSDECVVREIRVVLCQELYDRTRLIRIFFQVDELRSPSDYEASGDNRRLGVGLEQLRLD